MPSGAPAVALPLLLVLLLSLPAAAATITGRVVSSETGAPLLGATVLLEGTRIGAVTERDGSYRIAHIPDGRYTLVVTLIGYEPFRSELSLSGDETVVRDARLSPRAVDAREVVVTARSGRGTDIEARQVERNAPSVLDVMSAESIARYPDPSTADAVRRIPGISTTRVRGEAREAIVRGMEPRYNSTLLDGVKLPSPATNTRIVQLDYLASDLLERVEVTKSLTPDMEADAIGGTVNLVMRTAPEHRLLRARLGTAYGSTLLDNDFSSFRTDSILADPLERFGRGYQAAPGDFPRDNLKMLPGRAAPSLIGELTFGDRMLDDRLGVVVAASGQKIYQLSTTTRNYDAVDADNNLYLIRRQYRVHSHEKYRWGANVKTDFIVDPGNEVELALNGFIRENHEARLLGDTNFVYSPTLYLSSRAVVQSYFLGDAVLSGRHQLGTVNLRWRGGWAGARQTKPDRAELITSSALSGTTVVSDPVFYAVIRDWQRNDDRDLFGSLDVDWKGLDELSITVTAGGLYRAKRRDNYMNEYRLAPVTDSVQHLPRFTSIDEAEWEVLNTGGTPEYANNNYQCTEDVMAAYLMGSWRAGPWTLLAGARVERTEGEYFTSDVNLMAQVHAVKSYMDLLPSAHLRYALDPESDLRFSVGQSISRPNYFDVVPYNYVGEDYREMGNPNLRRAKSTNLDLRWETYPGSDHRYSAGIFYKKIDDPIEMVLSVDNPALPTLTPKNLGTATNYGLELMAATDVWDHISLQANYTYTHSAITTPKIINDRSAGAVRTVMETRPLQGQSEHIGNLALRYENMEIGTMGQVSFAYQGRRLSQVSVYAGLNHFESPFATLDLSLEQRIVGGLSLFLRLNNLTDTRYEVKAQEGSLIEREQFGRTLTLGVNFRN